MRVMRPVQGQRSRALVFFLAALIPVSFLASLVVLQTARDEQGRIESEARRHLERLVDRVDDEIAGHLEALKILADSPALDQPDLAAFIEHAKRAKSHQPMWRNVILVGVDGRQTANLANPVIDEPRPVVDRGSFDRVIESKLPVVGDTVPPSPYTGARGIGLRVPVFRGNEVKYVLTAVLEPTVLANVLRSALAGRYSGIIVDRNYRVVVRDSDGVERFGTPVSEPARNALEQDREGEFRTSRTREGTEIVALYRRSPRTGWSMHVGYPHDAFAAIRNRSVVFAALGGLAAVLFAAILIYLLYRDQQARRVAEAEQAQAQKIEAIGKLTGGVAHDFNNLLAVITGSLTLVLGTEQDKRTRRRLELALEASNRGASLTRQLLAFARRAVLQPQVIDAARHIHKMRRLFETSLRQDIRLQLEFEPNLWPVDIDPQQLDVALINLAANARDAMPDGGLFTISGSNVSVTNAEASLLQMRPGDYVLLRLTDTGTGMSQDILARAFEPFFTTKELDKGTGLGLSQVYGFAKQAGGSVAMESQPGLGTEVSLYLPRTTKPLASDHDVAVGESAGKLNLNALLVEDDPAVAETTKQMLEAAGCTVTWTANADSALANLGRSRFDIVVSDVVMDGMDGVQLAAAIRQQYGDIPVLLISGNLNDIRVNAASGFLQKPFSIRDLEMAILRCLPAKPTDPQ